MGAAKVSTDAVGDLLGAEQPGWLADGTLAMNPLRLDRVKPRTLDGQEAGQDAHALRLQLGTTPREELLGDWSDPDFVDCFL
jgi:hypothetical protein